jgi:vanadium-dependent haloperoxidase-like protein
MDAILYWNEVSLEANRVSHTNGKGEQPGPTLSSRALAIVHLAMYDAFAGVSGNPPDLPPYLTGC